MYKKLLASALALTLTFGAVGLPVAENKVNSVGISASAESLTSGDYKYTVLENGTVEISKYTGYDTEVTIPSEIDGKKVTAIGNKAFYTSWDLKTVTMPNSIKTIGNSAFAHGTELTSVNIPYGVTSIGEYAFDDCSNLKNKKIPNSVKSIGKHAFSGCSELTNITIPNKIETIGESAFAWSCIKSVKIPNSVKSIGKYAFYGLRSRAQMVMLFTATTTQRKRS